MRPLCPFFILLNRPCLSQYVADSLPNAVMHGHWPYISYGQCQLQLEREYCVKKVNKANSSPSKAVSCYFFIALHAKYMHQ